MGGSERRGVVRAGIPRASRAAIALGLAAGGTLAATLLCTCLFGPAGSPVTVAAEEAAASGTASVVTDDPDAGVPYVADELIVFSDPQATASEVESAAAACGARVIGSVEGVGAYLLRLDEPLSYEDLARRADELAQSPVISSAYPQVLMDLGGDEGLIDALGEAEVPAGGDASGEGSATYASLDEAIAATVGQTDRIEIQNNPPSDDAVWNAGWVTLTTYDDPDTPEDEAGQVVRYAQGATGANGLTQPIPVSWAYDAINLPQAWGALDIQLRGDPAVVGDDEPGSVPGEGVTVGIFDGPIYYEHEDLPEPLAVMQEDEPEAGWLESGHATRVAGIIAARTDNGTGTWGGTVGVAYGSQLVSLSYSSSGVDDYASGNSGGDTTLYSAYQYVCALDYLVGQGAKVLNFSNGLALDTFLRAANEGDEQAIEAIRTVNSIVSDTLVRLLDDGHDFVICKASGNSNSTSDADFGESGIEGGQNAALDVLSGLDDERLSSRIIVVGGVETTAPDTYQVAAYSAGGSRVDVVAPGTQVYSTSPRVPGWQSQDEGGAINQILSALTGSQSYEDQVGSGYWGASGTSFATPIVSGVAAMVWAVNPDLTGAQVKQIICSTATRQVGYSQEAQDEIDSNRFDPTLTYGLVDAELAVYAALESLEVSDQVQQVSAGPVGTFSYVAPAGGYRGSMTIGADGSVTLEEFMSGTGEGTTSYYTMAVDETVTTPELMTAYVLTPTGQEGQSWQMTDEGNVPTGTYEVTTNRWFTYNAGTDTFIDVSGGAEWVRVE